MLKKLVILGSLLMLGLTDSASAVLNYEYYEALEGAQYQALADVEFGVAAPVRIGTSDTLDSGNGNWVEQVDGHRADDFGLHFTGVIVVPISGEITFYLRSDDGSQLFIDGQLVVDNDGLHGTEAFPGDPGVITLDVGAHTIEATMFERGGGDSLHVAWSAGGQAPKRVPDSVLFLETPEDISIVPVETIVSTKAFDPVPNDGAVDLVDADVAVLSWTAGYGAIVYSVYISDDAVIDEGDLIATLPDTEIAVGLPTTPGATYYWRVDAVDATGAISEGDVWEATMLGLEAHFPAPADGSVWQSVDSQLAWIPGLGALVHNVFFSTDKALVEAKDPNAQVALWLPDATFDPGELEPATKYFWAVDEFLGYKTNPGPVWSFTTIDPDVELNIKSWGDVAASAEPAFQLTHVANGVYDIGDLSGDITYEFIVRSNPDETQASMALIGEMFANKAGIKYEQWNNTGTYGATLFGVVDLDFGVPTAPGENTHLTFVSSEELATTTLFVNGDEAASVDRAITLNGIVGLGRAIRDAEGAGFVDDFDGSIFGVAIYDVALTTAKIKRNAGAFLSPGVTDVTKAGDVIQGVPNDGDWPGGEPPAFAIDDDFGPLSSYGPGPGETAWLGTLLSNCSTGFVYVNELEAGTRTEAPLIRPVGKVEDYHGFRWQYL